MTIRKKNLPLKRRDNLKIQKVSNSEKIQKVGCPSPEQQVTIQWEMDSVNGSTVQSVICLVHWIPARRRTGTIIDIIY